jgi:hypothetical protein
MIIGAFQGELFSFQVEEAYNGYLVRPFDIATGEADDTDALLFRTAATAFAYAEMIATAERFSLSEDERDGDGLEDAFLKSRALYERLCGRLVDEGAPLRIVRQNDEAAANWRPTYH